MLTKLILQEVIKTQSDLLKKRDAGIERELLKKVKPTRSFALIITGIRRCGKSTLLHQMLSSTKTPYYLNLEDPRLAGFDVSDFIRAEGVFKELFGDAGTYFFDEIQNVPEWEKYIRNLVDRNEKVVITGSNASLLSRELGTKLTGRNLRCELFPFSYKEFLHLTNKEAGKESYNAYLANGGFPEYLKQKNDEILQRLFSDIVMRDVVHRHGLKNEQLVRKIANFVMTNSGKEFSYNSLKKTFEVNAIQTIIDYITFLEDAYLVFTIPLFSYSSKKQQVNAKKAYSIDTGLSSINSLRFSEDSGRALENQVFLALRRKHGEIFYYKDTIECDFVVKEKNRIVMAVQACLSLTEENKKREIDGLSHAMKEFKLSEGLILTLDQDDEFTVDGKKIAVKPVWKWLLDR
ncbi:MAG: ATP-binding protein [Nanoarchaeota archaeon]